MWTQDKCIAQAASLETSAEETPDPVLRNHYREIARNWRDLAAQAQWQDDFTPATPVLTIH
jgi:hypothetical protein